ncbi:MAG: flavin reductase family protein [Muribaculaceae bacterium]|nr:flavin reductase family protein [Muribaculaceae bacterium]
MRKDFGVKTWLYPMPVFIVAAYDDNGVPNAMNAAWGGIYTDNMVGMCISEVHKTTQNILKTRAFTVGMATADTAVPCDYVGIVSGNKIADKVSKAGFTTVKSSHVNAPIIENLPMALECELVSYDKETCFMTGKIVNVSVDEAVITADGKIDVEKLRPITYDPSNHAYRVIGEKVGEAFSDGKKLK